jgi:ATP-dependent exoDNAse (exonuclease V) alpha subunit
MGDDGRLFTEAAEHFAENRRHGIDTLVVIPFWEEIERFNTQAREALRRRGLLGEAEVVREAIKPLTWTDEQKTHWEHYRPGDRLLFARDTRFFRRGSSAEVAKVLPDGLYVTGLAGRYAKITRKQRGAFDVGRPQLLGVSAGDRLLMRSQEDRQGFANGDFKDVASVDPATGEIVFSDGKRLPPDFRAWTYGHALTSYRAQGSTAEESLLVLGEVAERALMRRQFYVANTRYRGRHTIYVSHPEAILQRLALPDPGRELATEFVERMSLAERLAPRPIQNLRPELRQAWLHFVQESQAERASENQKV